MMDLYSLTCRECSKLITKRYSTSFSMGIRVFSKEFRDPIYSIYGFVRFADEIVDTFHDFDKEMLLDKFRSDTYQAIEDGISLNPVLHSFQEVVNKYGIERNLIDAFLKSMEMDLYHNNYDESSYKEYIYGSAEVVGLMCLRVFVGGNDVSYNHLKESARSLGAAFQKVNFLRDIRSDFDIRSRVYFPGVDFTNFTQEQKLTIEADIENDFNHAYEGIVQLPKGCRLGVYVAFVYYRALFNKIKRSRASTIMNERIRVPNSKKVYYLLSSTLKEQLGLI
jgi:15-cis-phytoene synthase